MQRLRGQNQSIDGRIQSNQHTDRDKQMQQPQPQDYQSYNNVRSMSKGILEGRASSQKDQSQDQALQYANQIKDYNMKGLQMGDRRERSDKSEKSGSQAQ